jgi:hypothetical protein
LFVKAPEEEEPDMGNGVWGKPAVARWGPPSNTSPNVDSAWDSGVDDIKTGRNDGAWGQPFDGDDNADEQSWGKDEESDSKSIGSDNVDIIIRDNALQPQVSAEFATDGLEALGDQTSKLRIDTKVTPPSPKVDLSGWNVPAPAPPYTKVPAQAEVGQIGRGYIVAKTRRRITDDGGRSILATDQL